MTSKSFLSKVNEIEDLIRHFNHPKVILKTVIEEVKGYDYNKKTHTLVFR